MPNYPQRKSPRLANYDYTQNGAYFITICTVGRQPLFGQIENGMMQMNELGSLAQTCWFDIPLHRVNVELGTFVVMPNHVHGIVVLHVETPKVQRTGQVPSLQAGSLGTIVGAYKASVTRQQDKTGCLTMVRCGKNAITITLSAIYKVMNKSPRISRAIHSIGQKTRFTCRDAIHGVRD